MEEFSQVPGQRKVARTDSMRELAKGGDVQEMDRHCGMRFDWAVLATDGTAERSTVSSKGPMVSSGQGVMPVRQCEGERLQVIHTC